MNVFSKNFIPLKIIFYIKKSSKNIFQIFYAWPKMEFQAIKEKGWGRNFPFFHCKILTLP
jgi:hypothetical protein